MIIPYAVQSTEQPRIVGFDAASSTVNKDVGSGTATINVSLDSAATQAITVVCTITPVTAQSITYGLGQDYENISGVMTFAVGETTKNFAVPISNNPTVNIDRTFTVTLSSPVGASLGAITVHTCTIHDPVLEAGTWLNAATGEQYNWGTSSWEAATPALDPLIPTDPGEAVDNGTKLAAMTAYINGRENSCGAIYYPAGTYFHYDITPTTGTPNYPGITHYGAGATSILKKGPAVAKTPVVTNISAHATTPTFTLDEVIDVDGDSMGAGTCFYLEGAVRGDAWDDLLWGNGTMTRGMRIIAVAPDKLSFTAQWIGPLPIDTSAFPAWGAYSANFFHQRHNTYNLYVAAATYGADQVPVAFYDMVLDGNISNWGPYHDYELEQTYMLGFYGGSGAGALLVRMQDTTFQNMSIGMVHCRDHVHFKGYNLTCDNVGQTGFLVAGSASNTGGDYELIDFTGDGPDDIMSGGLHFEDLDIPTVTLTDITLEWGHLNLANKYSHAGGSGYILDNVTCKGHWNCSGGHSTDVWTISNSTFWVVDATISNFSSSGAEVTFDTCTFNYTKRTGVDTGTCGMTLYQNLLPCNLIFTDCTHTITNDGGDFPDGLIYAFYPSDNDNDLGSVVMNSPIFEAGFDYPIRIRGQNTSWTINNPTVADAVFCRLEIDATYGPPLLQINGGTYADPMTSLVDLAGTPKASFVLDMINMTLTETQNKIKCATTTWLNGLSVNPSGHRTITGVSNPTTADNGLLGDVWTFGANSWTVDEAADQGWNYSSTYRNTTWTAI